MIAALCVDQKNGMAFHHRRQSMDRVVRADLLSMADGNPIRMSPYSGHQFTEEGALLQLKEDPLFEAGPGALCFVEFPPLEPYLERLEGLVLYRWSRVYPADQWLDLDPAALFRLISTQEFPGHSHEKITKEVYRK